MGWKTSVYMIFIAVSLALSAGVVAGTPQTSVALSPTESTSPPGDLTRYDVVVTEATNGVGSFKAAVSVTNESVARIQNVSYRGSPAYSNNARGGDRVRVAATGMDTPDNGTVTIATVFVNATATGTTPIELTVNSMSDEDGSAYDVTGAEGSTLSVERSTDDDRADGISNEPTRTRERTPTESDDESDTEAVVSTTTDAPATPTETDTAVDTTVAPSTTTSDKPTVTDEDLTTTQETETTDAQSGGGAAPPPTENGPSQSFDLPLVGFVGILVAVLLVGLLLRRQ